MQVVAALSHQPEHALWIQPVLKHTLPNAASYPWILKDRADCAKLQSLFFQMRDSADFKLVARRAATHESVDPAEILNSMTLAKAKPAKKKGDNKKGSKTLPPQKLELEPFHFLHWAS